MNILISPSVHQTFVPPPGDFFPGSVDLSLLRRLKGPSSWVALVAGLLLVLFGAPTAAVAHETPLGCTGSGLGINLFTDSRDVHIGETITYSVTVFNGLPGSPRIVCDATAIIAGIVTPDGKTNFITLVRTALSQGESDFYPNVVTYVVRAQDILPDGTVRATAFDDGDIHQNDTNSRGGGDQGLNSEVVQPCILINAVCVGSIGENGQITFTGTVRNCGNAPLENVTVTRLVNGGTVQVIGPITLAIGQSVPFNGSWVPLNPCAPSTAVFTATGDDLLTLPRTVTSSASTTCAAELTPGIEVTKVCPIGPLSPGQLLTYSGTVRNTGNVTLTNVTVVSDQPANTVVFTAATLAPGATANFTGSYVAPVDCSTTSGVIARGTSLCGAAVTDSASSTCAVVTTPLIEVTTVCAATVAAPGGVQTYTGTVRNTGDIALRNVTVISDRPAANTTVFTVATLAPGASANFTGTYTVPLLNACAVTTTVVATGRDFCTDVAVTDTSAVTCGVTTTPLLALTLNCPATPVAAGALITFTGTVSNPGNVTLNNVTVVNNQASPSTVLTVPSLAPGASVNFTASFTAPANACAVSTTVNASGGDACTSVAVTATKSATCALVTTPRLAITQDCPTSPVGPGGLLTYSGTVRNTGDVTLRNVVVTDDRLGHSGNVTTTLWLDDQLPAGAVQGTEGGDSWNFVTGNPAPFSGTRAHQSSLSAGQHQHFFHSATATLAVNAGDRLVVHVYLDPANPPRELMLQWNDGVSWEHRAYWGENLLGYGVDGTSARRHMGPLPPAGQWMRLEVPAGLVGLEGRNLSGMAFALFDGRATWDAVGKAAGGANPTEVFTVATLAPGASASFTGSYTLPAAGACSVTTTLVAAAADNCTGVNVSATTTSTCPLVTTPAIVVTLACPATPGVQGGLLTYTGTVRNSGNITLTNIVVVNNRSGTTPVFTAATLAPGVTANFTGSFKVPLDCCSVSSTATATGADICTGEIVTDTSTSTCAVLTSPQITVTKVCSDEAVAVGDVLEYYGTVSNTGNITILDVTVASSQSVDGSPAFGPITLAPGESADYMVSFIVPPDFCGSDTVTARGFDLCTDFQVADSKTSICPVITNPRIEVTKDCPAEPTPRGGTYTYSGTVRNAGNVTLVNVFVFNSQPTNGTPVLGPITLAPGESRPFSGSYVPHCICCEIIDTVTARGQDRCTGTTVTARDTDVCPILTVPRLVLVQNCPPNPLTMGSQYQFSGYVTNTGDVNLTNVFVFGPQGTNIVLLGPLELAPGQAEPYFGSATVPFNVCSVPPVTATGQEVCRGTAIATNSVACPVATLPRLAITQECPVAPVSPGGLLTFRGTISNTGDITLTNVVVQNDRSGATPVFTVAMLTPGAVTNFSGSYVAASECAATSISTVTGRSICGIAVTNTASSTCPIVTTPQISVTVVCPSAPALPGGLLVYNGTVRNTGDITLTNVVVVSDRPVPNTPVLTIVALAPGAATNFTSSVAVPANACAVTTAFSATGRDICTLEAVTRSATTICPVITTQGLVVTLACPPVPGVPGSLVTFSGTMRNSGNVTLTNVSVFNGQSADGTPVTARISRAGGIVSVSWTATPGVIYQVQYRSGLENASWINLGGTVTAGSTVASQEDPIGANLQRFYRVRTVSSSPVSGPLTLAPGAVSNFSFSVTAPADACSVTGSVTVTGNGGCSGDLVTETAMVTCPLMTTPALVVTQTCPPNPAVPGGLLTFTGTVRNSGNITLNNVVVTNSRTGNLPLLTVASLAPGASTNFTGSYPAPASGPSVSTSTARATSLCGDAVTNSASSSCPILTTPGLAVTKLCPPGPVAPGGLLTFTGTVTNTGDVTMTNVFVVNSQPAANTPVLGPITLLPGAGTNFTRSYVVPLNVCEVTDTLTATGNSAATGDVLTDAATATCELVTTPAISITETCPVDRVTAGSSVVFGGLVSNTGDITLTNVLVFSSSPTNNTPVLGPITLAPGESAPFTGSFIALGGSNPTTNSTIVTNSSGTITTNTVSVITTNRTDVITTNTVTPTFGTINPVSGTITDRFAVVDGLHGLMFADQDVNWGPTLFYSTRHPGSGADQFETISTIPPSVGVLTDRFGLSATGYDAMTLAAPDVGYGAVNFYYVRHDASGDSTFGVIKAAGASSSSDLWAIPDSGYKGLAFAAADVGYGANMFYYVRQDVTGLSTFGTINPTPGGIAMDRYTVKPDTDALVFVPGAVSTWGTAIFAYLRHDDSGSIIGTIDPVTQLATDRVDLGTNFLTALTFTATDVGYGPNLFYYLRPAGTSQTTNVVTTFSTNTVITLITNTVTTFTTNSVVLFTPTNTVTAIGIDICQARTVTAAANCLGPVGLFAPPGPLLAASAPAVAVRATANGHFSLSFPTELGKSLTVQYKNSLGDPTWTVLETVVGTGGILPIMDADAAEHSARFYRVIVTPQ